MTHEELEAQAALAIVERLEAEHGWLDVRVVVTPVGLVDGVRRVRADVSRADTGGDSFRHEYDSPDGLHEMIGDVVARVTDSLPAEPENVTPFPDVAADKVVQIDASKADVKPRRPAGKAKPGGKAK